MTPRALEEYKALRATIGHRSTARVWLFSVGLVAWGGLTIATASLAALPIATLLPLLVLAAVFESVLVLHVGVERIGRYLQVFHEGPDRTDDPTAPAWEHAAMTFGPAPHGTRIDPLFSWFFILAAVLNFIPAVIAEPVALEVAVVGSAHLIFVARVVVARRACTKQRASDLDRFRRMREGS